MALCLRVVGVEEVEEMEGKEVEAGVASWKYIAISVLYFDIFFPLTMFLYSINHSSTVCSSFNFQIIEDPGHKRR